MHVRVLYFPPFLRFYSFCLLRLRIFSVVYLALWYGPDKAL